uniref:Uncharacterized protein n=1 Tax=Kalanchoe fedtschenkoi TaxID=63787 RepID=A0A7N0ZQI5_KALFE
MEGDQSEVGFEGNGRRREVGGILCGTEESSEIAEGEWSTVVEVMIAVVVLGIPRLDKRQIWQSSRFGAFFSKYGTLPAFMVLTICDSDRLVQLLCAVVLPRVERAVLASN